MEKEKEKILLKRAQGEVTSQTPIWLMRQAGRYLPEYRALREKHSFLDLCKTPELAAEVSLQPWKRFQLDGVILFSDILVPCEGMGIEMDFNPGPVIRNPLRTHKDVKFFGQLKNEPFNPDRHVPYVLKALQLLKKEIGDQSTLIGFCGAPWTVACYLIEGGHSENFDQIRRMIVDDPFLLHVLLDKLTVMMISYLEAQIHAGAEVVQVFDSLTVHLSDQHYKEFALPYEMRLIEAMKGKVPVILFVKDTARFVPSLKSVKDVILSCDASLNLSDARKELGDAVILQGNLDPVLLKEGAKDEIQSRTVEILKAMHGQRHILNLGHGVLPATPVENIQWLIDAVRNYE